MDELDTHYRPTIQLSNSEVKISVEEKFPGAAEEKPFIIDTIFNIPNTPEGAEVKEALERHIATGAPVDIYAPYIKAVEMPEFAKPFMGGDSFQPQSIHIGPATNQAQLIASIEFHCDDGDQFRLEYVHFKAVQAGHDEVTFSNENQPIPIRVTLVSQHKNRLGHVQFHVQPLPLNVHQLLVVSRFQTCVSKPYLARMTDISTGVVIMESRQGIGTGKAPDPGITEMLQDLSEIQIRTKCIITMPKRELTPEEWQIIVRLLGIRRDGKLYGKWGGLNVSFDPNGIQGVLDNFGGGRPGPIIGESAESEKLFGTLIPLGNVRTIYEEAVLTNEAEVRYKFEKQQGNSEAVIEARFGPTSNQTVVKEYLDWLPKRNQVAAA
ncbi:MAG: hypothetical protein HY259_13980 [Chloroflexi bacterium]|nr:hypothetical protein [Chloroflexota bacterium]